MFFISQTRWHTSLWTHNSPLKPLPGKQHTTQQLSFPS